MIAMWFIGYAFTVGLVGDYSLKSLAFKFIGWPVELGEHIRGKLE